MRHALLLAMVIAAVVTTNQAALWGVRKRLGSPDRMPGLGRLLE